MNEQEHTICDFCDRDHGTFYKYKGSDFCEYCWEELK